MQDYSLGDVARILKVSPRRLRYWQKTQLVDSSPQEAVPDSYAFRDLVSLRTIVTLLDQGVPLQRIRRNLELLRHRVPELDEPAAALRLWEDSADRLVVRRDGRLEETGGQLLLEFPSAENEAQEDVTSLAEIRDDLRSGDAQRWGFGVDSVGSDEAISWFERGCELDAETENWDAAIEAYENAIELQPDYADAYCNLGAVRYNQGQRREARAAFEACLALEANHVEANFNLANVLEEDGQDDVALLHYRRALAADPLYPDLHINLALLYEKLGQGRSACNHWRRTLQLDPQGSWADVARLRLEREPGVEFRIGGHRGAETRDD